VRCAAPGFRLKLAVSGQPLPGPREYDAELRLHDEVLRQAYHVETWHHVLDIGCGTGQTTRNAARMARTGSASGVDIRATAIERARELPPWPRTILPEVLGQCHERLARPPRPHPRNNHGRPAHPGTRDPRPRPRRDRAAQSLQRTRPTPVAHTPHPPRNRRARRLPPIHRLLHLTGRGRTPREHTPYLWHIRAGNAPRLSNYVPGAPSLTPGGWCVPGRDDRNDLAQQRHALVHHGRAALGACSEPGSRLLRRLVPCSLLDVIS